jgi:hypothetical protein
MKRPAALAAAAVVAFTVAVGARERVERYFHIDPPDTPAVHSFVGAVRTALGRVVGVVQLGGSVRPVGHLGMRHRKAATGEDENRDA